MKIELLIDGAKIYEKNIDSKEENIMHIILSEVERYYGHIPPELEESIEKRLFKQEEKK